MIDSFSLDGFAHMIRNTHFQNAAFLALLPFCLIPFWIDRRRAGKFGVPVASLTFGPEAVRRASAGFWPRYGALSRSLTLFLGLLAISRPQLYGDQADQGRDGIDVMLSIDTSGSMRARDFEINGERPDRLEVIKSVIADFIEARPDDRIGMVVFGSEAYTQAPLTLDHVILRKFLESVAIGIAGDGTAIGDGIATAVKRLKDTPGKSHVIILLTDGANNAGRIDPLAAAAAAKSFDIRIHTIGVGGEGVVPIVQNGRVFHIKADIDEKTLRAIADATGGVYRRAVDTDALINIYKEIDKLEKSRLEGPLQARGRDLFPYFLLAAIVILLTEIFWRQSRYRRLPV